MRRCTRKSNDAHRSSSIHLGITRAHFAGRIPTDWAALAGESPDLFASFTVVCPMAVDVRAAGPLGVRLMVLNGDHGQIADRVNAMTSQLPQAKLVAIPRCNAFGWTDIAADFPGPIGDAMLEFLAQSEGNTALKPVTQAEPEGEIDGVSYRIRSTKRASSQASRCSKSGAEQG